MREAIQTFLNSENETHTYYCENCDSIFSLNKSNPIVLHVENGSTPNSYLVTYTANCRHCGHLHMFYQTFYRDRHIGFIPTQHPVCISAPLLTKLHNLIYTYASGITLRNYKNRQNNPIYNELNTIFSISYSSMYCSLGQMLYKLYEADQSPRNIKEVKKLINCSNLTTIRDYIKEHRVFKTFSKDLQQRIHLITMLHNSTYRCRENSSDFHFLQSVINPEHIKFVNSLDRLNRECYTRSTESEVLNGTQTT